MVPQAIEQLLPLVQKPARYVGGELGCIYKKKDQVTVRFAFCFPDTYESVSYTHLHPYGKHHNFLHGLV